MTAPNEKPVIKLIGEDGNAFGILAKARRALLNAGADTEYVDKYLNEATAGDYDNLLAVTADYCKVV